MKTTKLTKSNQIGSMYWRPVKLVRGHAFATDASLAFNRITDPVKKAEAYLRRGLEQALERGLLLPDKTAPEKLYSGQHPQHPKPDNDGNITRDKVRELDMTACGRHWQRVGDGFYPTRQKPPLNEDEKYTLKCLRELSRCVNRFARYYADNRQREAFLLAFNIGNLFGRVDASTHAADVATGRPLRKGRPKGTATTKKMFAKRRAELTAKYQPDINRRVLQDGQSFETALTYTANQHKVPAETLRKYVVNPRRRTLPKKV